MGMRHFVERLFELLVYTECSEHLEYIQYLPGEQRMCKAGLINKLPVFYQLTD